MRLTPGTVDIAVQPNAAAGMMRARRANRPPGALGNDHAAIVAAGCDSSHGAKVPTQIKQGLARPDGTGRTPPTIVVEGVEELVKALLAA